MTKSFAVRTRVTGGMLTCVAALLWCNAARPTAQAGDSVHWVNLVHATAAGNSIQKAGGCDGCGDAGGTSSVAIARGDGYVEFTPRFGGRLYAGLGTTASGSADAALIDYAFSFWPDGGWDIREQNVYKTEGRFVAGDVFRVALVGTHIEYSQNGEVVYTSRVPPSLPLLLDTTLITAGAGLDAAVISGQELSPLPVPLSISTASLLDGPMLQPYSAALEAAGGSGTFTWSIPGGALPAGLSLAPAGTISGIPEAAGTSSFTVRATDAVVGNFVEQSLTLRIFVVYALTISPTTLSSSRIGAAYSATLNGAGGSGVYSWSVVGGSLPGGLLLDAVSGTIQGTTTTAGRFDVTVRAVDTADTTKLGEQTLALSVLAAPPPSVYDAIVDRAPRGKGPLPVLAGAGFVFTDPVFGARMLRVTDGALRPAAPNGSYRTPSGTHSNAWSADGRLFYTTSTDGTVVPFAFDAATMRASRLPSANGDGGLTLQFFNEPTFSYVTPGVAYATYNGSGSNLRSVDQYDFQSDQYSQLLNLDSLATGMEGTYTGGLGASGGDVERLFAFFGGTSQDRHFYLVVFDKLNPSNRLLLDTIASTVDGQPTNIPLNFKIHAAAIDRSGRYVTVYPTGPDLQKPRSAAPAYVWDTLTNTFTAIPLVAAIAGGHDAYGFGYRVNQDSTATSWDAAQWQLRSLATPLATLQLITPVLRPEEEFLADHPSWHNAQPERLVPFIDANYRYGTTTVEWRAWDEEIFAVQTEGAGGGASVWRFAHHRSAVASDVDPTWIGFWYTPRPNVSPDGRWALFTSNWEKTLGTDPRGDSSSTHRQDVFLVELERSTIVANPVVIGTTAVPSGRASQSYAATLQASGGSGSFVWRIVAGALPAGLTLNMNTGVIAGTPAAAGTRSFIVSASDAADYANADDQTLTIAIAPAPVVIITTSLPDARRRIPYSATLTAGGGRTPLQWSILSDTLPPGLTLDADTGTISGTPTRTGTWSFTVRVADSAVPPSADTQVLSISVRKRKSRNLRTLPPAVPPHARPPAD
jgi:hypothetical protein